MSEMIRFLRAFLFACYRVSYEPDDKVSKSNSSLIVIGCPMSEMIRFLRAFLFACYRVSYERDDKVSKSISLCLL